MEETTATPDPTPQRSRWGTIAWIASSVLLVVLVVAVWMRVSSGREGANLANAIIDGKRPDAPTLPTEPVVEGGDTTIPEGEVVVVNWWASWCGPCKEEAPVLNEVAEDYDGRVTIVGLNAGSKDLRSAARKFARKYELDFVLVRGDRSDEDAWGTHNFPETFVVGTDGRISSYVPGAIDEEILRGLIEAELEEDRS